MAFATRWTSASTASNDRPHNPAIRPSFLTGARFALRFDAAITPTTHPRCRHRAGSRLPGVRRVGDRRGCARFTLLIFPIPMGILITGPGADHLELLVALSQVGDLSRSARRPTYSP